MQYWAKSRQQFANALLFCVYLFSATAAHAAIEISEFLASNNSSIVDEDGEHEDWIELHNNGTSAVDLSGWYLTDDAGDLTQWAVPAVVLQPQRYLVVFASGKDRTSPILHTNFKLKTGGEYLALVRPDGSTIEDDYAPSYPEQFSDISYAAGQYFLQPTPGTANGIGVAGFLAPVGLSVPHGIYNTPQSLIMTATNGADIRYTLDGTTPTVTSARYTGPITLTSTTTINATVYFNEFPISLVHTETYELSYVTPGDGIPDTWREQYFGPDFASNPDVAADADPDGDGSLNIEEYRAGTDPTDRLSGFKARVATVPKIMFPTVPGQTYRVLKLATPTSNPVVLTTIDADSDEAAFVDDDPGSTGIYVIEVVTTP